MDMIMNMYMDEELALDMDMIMNMELDGELVIMSFKANTYIASSYQNMLYFLCGQPSSWALWAQSYMLK